MLVPDLRISFESCCHFGKGMGWHHGNDWLGEPCFALARDFVLPLLWFYDVLIQFPHTVALKNTQIKLERFSEKFFQTILPCAMNSDYTSSSVLWGVVTGLISALNPKH